MNLLYLLLPVLLLVLSVVLSIVLVKRGTPAKKALATHFLSVVAIMILTCMLPLGAAAAEDPADSVGTGGADAGGQLQGPGVYRRGAGCRPGGHRRRHRGCGGRSGGNRRDGGRSEILR